MVSITRKIKKSELYKLAEIYHIHGFDDIPIDEARNMTSNKKKRIKIYMNNMKKEEDANDELLLRPITKGKREGIVGYKVGKTYRKGIDTLIKDNLLITSKGKKKKTNKRRIKKD
tara:strand:- start:5944 stop:6288 length:345 start_codon:yes stop_codon:yes gene_type:complete